MKTSLVEIASYDSAIEAESARSFLESQEIPAFVNGGEIVAAASYLGNAVGYVRLEVPNEHAEAAAEILKTLREQREAERPDLADDEFRCLACGLVMQESDSECWQCGWSYGETEEGDDNYDAKGAASMQGLRDLGKPFISIWVGLILVLLVVAVIAIVLSVGAALLILPFALIAEGFRNPVAGIISLAIIVGVIWIGLLIRAEFRKKK